MTRRMHLQTNLPFTLPDLHDQAQIVSERIPGAKVIISPYRICPLGAHVDHQGGVVLGRTIHAGTVLSYAPSGGREISITSDQFGEARFSLDEPIKLQHWSRYAQAAARVFGDKLRRGMQACVSGSLVGVGLSSSASVGLAYLKALADVNEIELSNPQLVQLDFALEYEQLGLQNGILDPLTIVYGQARALLFMDTLTASVKPVFDTAETDSLAWIVAFSGISRELTKSGFNSRVAECHQAAALLQAGAYKLSDVPRAVFEQKKLSLPAALRRRAEHFFSEVERVQNGAQAWAEADFASFGQMMNQSCESSIRSYESGSEVLIQLHELVSSFPGVFGSRFSGGGYGGCVIALVQRVAAETIAANIAEQFSALRPELPSAVYLVETDDGLR